MRSRCLRSTQKFEDRVQHAANFCVSRLRTWHKRGKMFELFRMKRKRAAAGIMKTISHQQLRSDGFLSYGGHLERHSFAWFFFVLKENEWVEQSDWCVCVWGTGGKHCGGSETEKHRHEMLSISSTKEQSNEQNKFFKKIQMKCNEMNLRGGDEDKQQQQQAQNQIKPFVCFLLCRHKNDDNHNIIVCHVFVWFLQKKKTEHRREYDQSLFRTRIHASWKEKRVRQSELFFHQRRCRV